MVVLFALLLLGCARAQFPPLRMGKGKKMTPEEFHKIPDDPMGDPADEIPPVPDFAKPGDTPSSLGLLGRDRYLEEERSKGNTKKEERLLLNFEQIHDKLIEEQSRHEPYTRKPFRQQGYTANVLAETDKTYKEKFAEFEPQTFTLQSQNIFRSPKLQKYLKPIVWSTCDDFKWGTSVFNPDEVINLMWIPFYTWSQEMNVMSIVHKFTVPTQKQVYDYKKKYGPYLNRSIDWYQPKLYLEQDLGRQHAMLISVDQTGLYYFIFPNDVSVYAQEHKLIFPLITVRLKIVRNYLAMMYCEQNLALMMAMDGHVPPTNKDKRETAKILGLRGKGRPVTRNEESEQTRQKLEQDRKNQLKALKYLPTDGRGYLDGSIPGDTPMDRRKQNEEKIRVVPDRAVH